MSRLFFAERIFARVFRAHGVRVDVRPADHTAAENSGKWKRYGFSMTFNQGIITEPVTDRCLILVQQLELAARFAVGGDVRPRLLAVSTIEVTGEPLFPMTANNPTMDTYWIGISFRGQFDREHDRGDLFFGGR